MSSLGNMYPNLPGMLVEFQDGGQSLRFNESEASTDSMLILGTAVDGPVMEAIAVDENSAELLFGSELKSNGSPNGSTLIKSFKKAMDAGCKDIRLMRISGSTAKAIVNAPSSKTDITNRVDKDLGYMPGNDITDIHLGQTGIVASSVKVYAKGKLIDSKNITLNAADPLGFKVSIAKNVCDAGSVLSISYDYEVQENIVDANLVPDSNNKIYLTKTPVTGSVKVKDTVSNEYLLPADFVLSGKEIVILENSTYTIEYKNLVQSNDIVAVDKSSVPLVAKTSDYVISLGGDIDNSDNLSLYIDDSLILDKSLYTVDAVLNTISIKKEAFSLGEAISVSFFVITEQETVNQIIVESLFGGEVYNEAKVEIFDLKDTLGNVICKALKLTKPASKLSTGELPLIFPFNDFETFEELVDAINASSGIFKASTMTPEALTSELYYKELYFMYGDDGVNLTTEQLFQCLSGVRNSIGLLEKQGAYQLLENYQVDWIVPAGAYADSVLLDRNKNFAYELALFCAINSYRNKAIHGVMAMAPLKDTSLASVQMHAKYLANYKNQYFMKDNQGSIITDGQGNPIDLGKFISIVAGPTVAVSHFNASLKDSDGAVEYAAYNTALLPQSAPTNKKLGASVGIKYNFSNSQLNDIVGNRLVCFGKRFSTKGQALQGAYIVDGPTCARPGSEYARLSTVKVLKEVTDQVRDVANPFIGEANTIEQRNALSAAISKRLDTLVSMGVILQYNFNLVATQLDQVLGQANLELGIVAPQELKKINTVLGLKR